MRDFFAALYLISCRPAPLGDFFLRNGRGKGYNRVNMTATVIRNMFNFLFGESCDISFGPSPRDVPRSARDISSTDRTSGEGFAPRSSGASAKRVRGQSCNVINSLIIFRKRDRRYRESSATFDSRAIKVTRFITHDTRLAFRKVFTELFVSARYNGIAPILRYHAYE